MTIKNSRDRNSNIEQTRTLTMDNIKTREEGSDFLISGYFAKYNKVTELFRDAYEEIAPGAFNSSLVSNDIRALIDHETRLVLGRTKADTLELKSDETGLYGTIRINENDSDAVNLYERVKRGDVDQCSFGFNIIKEGFAENDDGSVKWTLEEVDLHEVSVVTFPAYEDTGVQARKSQITNMVKRERELEIQKLKERLNK